MKNTSRTPHVLRTRCRPYRKHKKSYYFWTNSSIDSKFLSWVDRCKDTWHNTQVFDLTYFSRSLWGQSSIWITQLARFVSAGAIDQKLSTYYIPPRSYLSVRYISWLSHQRAKTKTPTPKLMAGSPQNFKHIIMYISRMVHDIPYHQTFSLDLIFNVTEVQVLSTNYEFASLTSLISNIQVGGICKFLS
jgi:hypothetical protein